MEFDIMEQQTAAVHYCGTFIRKAFDAVFFSQMSRKKKSPRFRSGSEGIGDNFNINYSPFVFLFGKNVPKISPIF